MRNPINIKNILKETIQTLHLIKIKLAISAKRNRGGPLVRRVLQWQSSRGWERVSPYIFQFMLEEVYYENSGLISPLSAVRQLLRGESKSWIVRFSEYSKTWDYKEEQKRYEFIEREAGF